MRSRRTCPERSRRDPLPAGSTRNVARNFHHDLGFAFARPLHKPRPQKTGKGTSSARADQDQEKRNRASALRCARVGRTLLSVAFDPAFELDENPHRRQHHRERAAIQHRLKPLHAMSNLTQASSGSESSSGNSCPILRNAAMRILCMVTTVLKRAVVPMSGLRTGVPV